MSQRYKKGIKLDGNWELYIAENRHCKEFASEIRTEDELKAKDFQHIKGTVPGNFELDMQREGLIPDLFFDVNTLEAQRLENRHLWYVCHFDFEGNPAGYNFMFEGVDTFAEYYLNGEKLGESANMLIEQELAATYLKQGENELMVHIRPTEIESRSHEKCMGRKNHHGSNTVRKSPSMFGWDIMPRIISGGIWKSVYLYKNQGDYIKKIRTFRNNYTIPSYGELYYELNIDNDFLGDYRLEIHGCCGDSVFHQMRKIPAVSGTLYGITIEDIKLWWPHTMGEPNLYDFTYTLWRGDEAVDVYKERVGFRTVELKRTDVMDENGNGEFKFYINGEPFFAMGTNWVPLSPYPSQFLEKLPKAMEMVKESGCNIIRCWGGNVYEYDEFYDMCDEMGITVWQDFSMACQDYPQNEEFQQELAREARAVINRIGHHASVILWAGDNEVDRCMYRHKDPNDNVLTRKVLPTQILEHDTRRPYLPSSPYISPAAYNDGNLKPLPEDHLWGPRIYYKEDFKENVYARFASETGYHGCPSPEAVKKFIAPENLWPWADNDAWIVHATSTTLERECNDCADRIPLMDKQIRVLFGDSVPDGLESYALASQLSQSEAFKFNIERFRTGKIGWERTGIIWWNLLDGWPQFSDAVVDYNLYKKLAYHTISRCQEPVCLMFRDPCTINEGTLDLVVANETLEEKTYSYKVTNIADGNLLLQGEGKIAANSAEKIVTLTEEIGNTLLLIEYEVEGKACKNHYLSGKPLYDFKTVVEWFKKAELLDIEGFNQY